MRAGLLKIVMGMMLAGKALGQTEAATGVIAGLVTDQNGGAVKQAVVKAKNDFGFSANDVQHRAVLSSVVQLPFGFAYNAVLPNDANGDGNLNDRPYRNGLVEPLNNYRQPKYFNWNTRLTKDWKFAEKHTVQTTAEIFNLTNGSNFTTTNTTVGTAAFRRSNLPGPPFRVQLSARYRF